MLNRWTITLAVFCVLGAATATLLRWHEPASKDSGAAQVETPVAQSAREASRLRSELEETAERERADATIDEEPGFDTPVVTERPPLRASSFLALLQSYDATDQELLRRFDRRYRGALQFQNEEQLQWMAERGYPMPEDILEARTLSDEELRAAASGGDDKYLFLYADRVLQGLIATRRDYLGSGLDPSAINEYPEFTRQLVEATRITTELARSDSPFAGYAMSQMHWITTGDPYAQLASLHMTIARGDLRAYRTAEAIIRDSELPPEVGDALAAYSVVVKRTCAGAGETIPFGL